MSDKPQLPVAAPTLSTGGKLQPIVPQNWNEAVQMASAFVRAGMVPKHFEGSPEKATVAILAGLEVGLTPMAALQSIAVINNMPTIFGDGMLGLVRASGLLEDIEEGVEWDKAGKEPMAATCRVKRKGEKTWGTHTFTMQDAFKGGLLNKPGPWKQYPQRMLAMRARAWALRDKFADVLRGLKSAEEVQDMVDITPSSAAVPAAEPQQGDYHPQERAAPAEAQAAEAQTEAPAKADKPPVTDVQDENEPPIFKFEQFKSTTPFIEFAQHFLENEGNNPDGAAQFLAFYKETMEKTVAHPKCTEKIKGAIEMLQAMAEERMAPTREPGEEG